MRLPANKIAALADLDKLGIEEEILPKVPDLIRGQHAIRLWEYAMAYQTILDWKAQQDTRVREAAVRMAQTVAQTLGGIPHEAVVCTPPLQICDVGGAGSNFWKLLATLTTDHVLLVDPAAPPAGNPDGDRSGLFCGPLEEYAANYPHDQWDVLTCISVIEHLEAVRPLLRAAHMLLRRGGLLFLTTDCWNSDGEDRAHFHWMRRRIYNPYSMTRLAKDLREVGFATFGTSDWHYYEHTLYDYSVASLAMVKK